MKTEYPLPLYAHPKISYYEQPSPIPIVCTREYLILLLTILMTPYVSETSPSVNKKICFGWPSIIFFSNMLFSGS